MPKCVEQETFSAGIRVGHEMQREVHPEFADPTRPAEFLNLGFLLQGERQMIHGVARRTINVDSDEQSFAHTPLPTHDPRSTTAEPYRAQPVTPEISPYRGRRRN